MANKKKPIAPKRTSKRFLGAADQTPVQIRRLMERLTQETKKELIGTDIPSFKSISSDKDFINHFFLNRQLYTDLLGDHIRLLDRVVKSSFATIMAKDLMAGFFDKENITIPGLWDEFHIKSLFITRINFTTVADDPDQNMYASVRIHKEPPTMEEAKEFSPNTWFKFGDYTPQKLYTFLELVSESIITFAVKELETVLPTATYTVTGEPVTVRYGRQFGELMNPVLKELTLEGSIDEQVEPYVKALEKPLMTYMTALLSESGFNVEAVSDMFSASRATVGYDIRNKGGKNASTFVHPWTKLYYKIFSTEVEGIMAGCDICPMDVKIAASVADRNEVKVDEKTGEETKVPAVLTTDERNACNRLGKSLMGFLDSLSNQLVGIAISRENRRIGAEIQALNEAAKESGELEN